MCSFECIDPVGITNNITATHLYRIAQEAVSNAIRHSEANQIVVSLAQVDNDVILEIRDNGVGIDAGLLDQANVSKRSSGFGLGIMDYRAELVGGTLHIGRQDNSGTIVRAVFPREVLND